MSVSHGGRGETAPRQLLSRRLVVGLGRYGGLVAQHVQAHLACEPTEANQLTRVLDLQPDKAASGGSADCSRRAVRQQLSRRPRVRQGLQGDRLCGAAMRPHAPDRQRCRRD